MHTATPRDAEHKVKSAVEHLEEGGRRVKKDVRDAAEHAQGDFNSIAHSIGEQVREYIENAGEGLSQAKDSIADAGDTVAAKIKDNPLSSGILLLGLGVMLGVLLRRH